MHEEVRRKIFRNHLLVAWVSCLPLGLLGRFVYWIFAKEWNGIRRATLDLWQGGMSPERSIEILFVLTLMGLSLLGLVLAAITTLAYTLAHVQQSEHWLRIGHRIRMIAWFFVIPILALFVAVMFFFMVKDLLR